MLMDLFVSFCYRSPGEGLHAGRTPSVHSLISVQEAKEGNRVDGTTTEGRKTSLTPSRTKSVASLGSQVNQDGKLINVEEKQSNSNVWEKQSNNNESFIFHYGFLLCA